MTKWRSKTQSQIPGSRSALRCLILRKCVHSALVSILLTGVHCSLVLVEAAWRNVEQQSSERQGEAERASLGMRVASGCCLMRRVSIDTIVQCCCDPPGARILSQQTEN